MKKRLSTQNVPSELWDLAETWRQAASDYQSPFCTLEFIQLVAEIRDDVRVLVLGKGSVPDLIWPLQISRSGWARPVGAPFSNSNSPFIRPGATFDLSDVISAFKLSGFNAQGLIPHHALRVTGGQPSSSYITDLTHGADAFFADRKKEYPAHFKRLFSLERKLHRENPGTVFTFDDRSEEMRRQLIYFQCMQLAQTHRHNILGPAWVDAMLESLKALKSQDLKTTLSTLRNGDQLIAGELNISSHDQLAGWITAFNPDYKKYSPGNLLAYKIIESMPLHGLKIYDAGVGNGHYKKYFSNRQTSLINGVFFAEQARPELTSMLYKGWINMEGKMPPGLANPMGRMRRRADTINSVETRFSGKVKGFTKAAFPFLNGLGR